MLKMILGIIVGFIVWTVLWIGSDAAFSLISPDWYGKETGALHEAVHNQTAYFTNSSVLVLSFIRSLVCSLIAGYLAVLISKEQPKTTLILGVLLLLAGISAEAVFWNYVPLWYHLSFLILLIPMTILGGKLRKI